MSVFDIRNPRVTGTLTVDRLRVKKRRLDLPDASIASFAIDTTDGHLVDTETNQFVRGQKDFLDFNLVDMGQNVLATKDQIIDAALNSNRGDVYVNETNYFNGHNEFSDFQLNDVPNGTNATLEQIVAIANDGTTLSTTQTVTGAKTFTNLNLTYGEGNTITHQQLVDAALGGGGGGGDVYLADNQTFTGRNTFKDAVLENDSNGQSVTSAEIITATREFTNDYKPIILGQYNDNNKANESQNGYEPKTWYDIRRAEDMINYTYNYAFGKVAHPDAPNLTRFKYMSTDGSINCFGIFCLRDANPFLEWKDYGSSKLSNYWVIPSLVSVLNNTNQGEIRIVLSYDNGDIIYLKGRVIPLLVSKFDEVAGRKQSLPNEMVLFEHNKLSTKTITHQATLPISTIASPGMLYGIFGADATTFPVLFSSDGVEWNETNWDFYNGVLRYVYDAVAVDVNKVISIYTARNGITAITGSNQIFYNMALVLSGQNTWVYSPPNTFSCVNLEYPNRIYRVSTEKALLSGDGETGDTYFSGLNTYVKFDLAETVLDSIQFFNLPTDATILTAFVYLMYTKSGADFNCGNSYLYVAIRDSSDVVHVTNKNVDKAFRDDNPFNDNPSGLFYNFWCAGAATTGTLLKIHHPKDFDNSVQHSVYLLADIGLPIMVFFNHFDSALLSPQTITL
jgi:hypothetical protein